MSLKVNNKKASDDQFNQAADLIGLDEEVRLSLIAPDRELMVEVPLRKDDGSIQSFRGYRVQHNNSRGPFKGGIRFHGRRLNPHFPSRSRYTPRPWAMR